MDRSEVFPGPDVQSDQELSALARATHHTVYHVSCEDEIMQSLWEAALR